jgi:ubiquinone/menaquinone biosynthesis C-methylase UbiE
MLDAAKRNLNEKSTHVDFRLGYLEHLPVADNSIDIAVSHMVVSFLNNLDKAFSDTHRVLKNLGRIAIIESYATQTDPLSYPTDNLPRVPVSMIVETLEQVGFKSVTHKEIEKEVFLITGNK